MARRDIIAAAAVILTALFLTGCPNPNGSTEPPTTYTVSYDAIGGVPSPVTHETPVTRVTETEQYTGTVVWTPGISGTFAADTTYAATIILTAKTGYTFSGVGANFFSVAGAAENGVSNAADSGVVTAIFPATDFSLFYDTEDFREVIASGSTGDFSMGYVGDYYYEAPVHEVTLTRPYSINTFEITNDQFATVMNKALYRGWITADASAMQNANGDQHDLLDVDSEDCRIDYTDGQLVVDSGYGDHPVTCVTWYGAVAFAYYLNELEEREQTYNLDDWSMDATKSGYRLPTEAEWEYAARGGAASMGYTYSGSDTVDDVAWYEDNSEGVIHAVGMKAANELGTYDMSGNVCEWCHDWYYVYYYENTPASDPEGPTSGTYRALRGGSWNYSADYQRSTRRRNWIPTGRYNFFGFRLVVPPAP